MKRLISILALLVSFSAAQAEVWAFRLPEPALLPSYAKATYLSRMHERHGGSHLGMQEYTVNLPFADPRRSHMGHWYYSVQGSATVSLMDVGGNTLDLKKDELMMFSVPLTLIRPIDSRQRFMLSVVPRFAGDAQSAAYAWDLPVVVDYSVTHSPEFSYSLGVAVSPRFSPYGVMPYLSATWKMSPDWQLRLKDTELALLYSATDKLLVGPYMGMEGGTWMVNTPIGQRIFRVRSLVAGLHAEYDFAPPGGSKRVIVANVGATLATSAQFLQRTANKDAIESHHYKPGVVVSLGVDFRF